VCLSVYASTASRTRWKRGRDLCSDAAVLISHPPSGTMKDRASSPCCSCGHGTGGVGGGGGGLGGGRRSWKSSSLYVCRCSGVAHRAAAVDWVIFDVQDGDRYTYSRLCTCRAAVRMAWGVTGWLSSGYRVSSPYCAVCAHGCWLLLCTLSWPALQQP
jgi:hypothetical protein